MSAIGGSRAGGSAPMKRNVSSSSEDEEETGKDSSLHKKAKTMHIPDEHIVVIKIKFELLNAAIKRETLRLQNAPDTDAKVRKLEKDMIHLRKLLKKQKIMKVDFTEAQINHIRENAKRNAGIE